VHAPVIDDLKPGGEQAVELRELDTVVDLDQELIADGLHQANAKLVFRVSVVRDALGSGLYRMKQHVRRPRNPLRRHQK
jgi:hypothetical protein